MKVVKTKRIVHNSVTGKDYAVYERESEPNDPPIKGLWKEKYKKNKNRGNV